MANGDGPSDPDQYVLRSGVRAGLKREFAFALKVQAELPAFLGRTRSNRSFSPSAAAPVASPRGAAKRSKQSDAGGRQPASKAAEPPPPPDPVDALLLPLPPTPSPAEAEAPCRIDVQDESMAEANPLENGPASMAAAEITDALVTDVVENVMAICPTDAALPGSTDNSCSEVNTLLDACCAETSGDNLASQNPPNTFLSSASKFSLLEPANGTPPAAAAVEQAESSFETPLMSEKPTRRFTRSALKDTPDDEKVVPLENSATEIESNVWKDDGAVIAEKPTRRFTRSLLKGKTEDSGPGSEATTSDGSVGSDDIKGTTDAVDGSLSSPNKKMELKMSKKIALTKLPGNVRELLATGLLEGFPVKYSVPRGKLPILHGVIKGNNILCSCVSCNGCKAVSPYNFELHAGSTKKHPSDYICLENGYSIRDILKTCVNAPLDMLEATIQNAIGPVPEKRSYTCQKCNGSFDSSRTGKFALFCDMCIDIKPPQICSSPQAGVSSTRLSRKKSIPSAPGNSSKNASPRKSPPSAPNYSSKNASSGKSLPSALDSSLKYPPSGKKTNSVGRLTRKDVGLHKLVFMNGILPEGTEVGYYVGGKRLLLGYIKDSGIYCKCGCSNVVSPSQFESHAGRAARRKPYNNIYTSNGVSLHELSVSLSKGRKMSASQNDDLCSICADGGDLLLCDLCPRAFHKECVGLSSIPKGDWYCQYCHSLHQRERCLAHNNNAIAAGRVAGVDPIEQIFKRAIRIVTTSETYVGGCTLCKLHDFSKSFDARTVLLCDQCEKEYHVGCLKEHNMADLKELPEGEWFCCADCCRIHKSLQDLLLHGAESLPQIDVDVIKKKHDEQGLNLDAGMDLRWRLLRGRDAAEDCKLLLSKAVSIFHESFDPIVEALTGRDLIPAMVYGRTLRDQDYAGMYCAVLTVGGSVVSAGLFRVMGSQVAELPLVATSRDSQGKGYFQSLFSCIERWLSSLKVKHFVLPAAEEAESIWTKKFGFTKITSDQLQIYLNRARTTVFQGTSTLHKLVPDS